MDDRLAGQVLEVHVPELEHRPGLRGGELRDERGIHGLLVDEHAATRAGSVPQGGGRRRLLQFLHRFEVLAGTGGGALGGVHQPAHHAGRLAGHDNQLQQQDHIPEREAPVDRLPEQGEVDGEEDDVHPAHAEDVHHVPVAGLHAGDLHGVVEVLLEDAQLAQLRDEGLHHLHLADDLSEPALGGIDVLVFLLLPDDPLPARQCGEPQVHREDDGQ